MAMNHTTAVVRADLRDADEVLSRAGKLLDFARPMGLLFVGCLHHIADPGPALPAAWGRHRLESARQA
jgi:hypothetical protein